VGQELKLALRAIRANRGFSFVVLLTLALGIGANTAIFSVVDAVVLRPLPYREPQRLYFIFPTNPKDGGKDRLSRMAEVEILRRQLRSFSDLAMASKMWEAMASDGSGEAAPIRGVTASANLLDVLGIEPLLGRGILPEEDVEGGPRVAMLTHAAWLRRYGGDPGAVGRSLVVGARAARIVGVLPPEVTFPDPACEIWLPARQSSALRRWRLLTVVGRLAGGASEAAARAELATAARRLEAEFPDVNAGMGLRMSGLQQELTQGTRPTLLVLLGAVGLVLLIACANVVNLTLARGLSRRAEMAVRAALGASRGRLVRQLVLEGLLLALAGGVAGVVLAAWGVELAMRASPIPVPGAHGVAVDGRLLAFTLAISVLTGVGSSLVPAWRLLGTDPQQILREQGRGATQSSGHRRLARGLVVAEVALALLLLAGAGLLMRTVARLLAVDPGFDPRNLVTLQVVPPADERDLGKLLSLNTALERRLRALPGVVSVGQGSRVPLVNMPNVLQALEIQDRPVPTGQRPSIDVRYTTTEYFGAMGIPLVRGRLVSERDVDTATINEAAARRFWPGEDPVGKLIRTQSTADPASPWLRIVGIVGSVRHLGLDVEPRPELYVYAAVNERVSFVVRTSADPVAMLPALREAVRAVDRRFGVLSIQTMDGLVRQSMATRRFGMLLLGAFAAMALLLAAVGLYGVMSYAVSQRRKEIGVRMALGARARDVALMVVREGMALVLLGAAAGLAAALALTRLMSTLLFDVSAFDPAVLAAVCALLALVAALACYLPARRAAGVDPMLVLRDG
jgi:predicted permease